MFTSETWEGSMRQTHSTQAAAEERGLAGGMTGTNVYRIICRSDRDPARPDEPGPFILTSKTFNSLTYARQYAATINPSREPRILKEIT